MSAAGSTGSTGFASVVIDVDSTLCGIEGIDWLAARRGPDVGRRVAALTEAAMRGEIALDDVYGQRLELVRPSRADVAALAEAYVESVEPGAPEVLRKLARRGRRIVLVSGGLREVILPVARVAGMSDQDVHAVSIRFMPDGSYAGYDASSPLATSDGKRTIVSSLGLPRRILAMGDGSTDLAMRPVVDAFAAFTGFVRRGTVVAAADHVVETFEELMALVLR